MNDSNNLGILMPMPTSIVQATSMFNMGTCYFSHNNSTYFYSEEHLLPVVEVNKQIGSKRSYSWAVKSLLGVFNTPLITRSIIVSCLDFEVSEVLKGQVAHPPAVR